MLLDVGVIRTEPGLGEEHSFSPPAGFDGSAQEYLALMRHRYRREYHPHGQRMAVAARFAVTSVPLFTGPYAAQAQLIVNSLKPKRLKTAA